MHPSPEGTHGSLAPALDLSAPYFSGTMVRPVTRAHRARNNIELLPPIADFTAAGLAAVAAQEQQTGNPANPVSASAPAINPAPNTAPNPAPPPPAPGPGPSPAPPAPTVPQALTNNQVNAGAAQQNADYEDEAAQGEEEGEEDGGDEQNEDQNGEQQLADEEEVQGAQHGARGSGSGRASRTASAVAGARASSKRDPNQELTPRQQGKSARKRRTDDERDSHAGSKRRRHVAEASSPVGGSQQQANASGGRPEQALSNRRSEIPGRKSEHFTSQSMYLTISTTTTCKWQTSISSVCRRSTCGGTGWMKWKKHGIKSSVARSRLTSREGRKQLRETSS